MVRDFLSPPPPLRTAVTPTPLRPGGFLGGRFTALRCRWVDVSLWNERGQRNKQITNKSAIEGMRTRVPAALRQKHPSLPVVVISGLPFHKTQEDVM